MRLMVARRFLRMRYLVGLTVVIAGGYFVRHSALPAVFRLHPVPLIREFEDIPLWMRSSRCFLDNNVDKSEAELALTVFKNFSNWTLMKNSAFSYFGGIRVFNSDHLFGLPCPNLQILDDFAALSIRDHYWRGGGFPGDHDLTHLRVARILGPRYPEIVTVVAETAFAPSPIEDRGGVPRDIRPLARVILAEFGAAAAPWSEKAFGAMSGNSELETTSAQIAVATQHPGALQKTTALLDGILRDYPNDPIPEHAWMRFYELAYALVAAGQEARPFIDPVVKMTCRKIDVWSPPFGWVPNSPGEMDRVLAIIGVDPCRAHTDR